MAEAVKPKTENASVNSARPAPKIEDDAKDPGPAAAAAAAPCACEERLSMLEGRWAATDTLIRAMSWCFLAVGAAVLYILWTGGDKPAEKTAGK